MIKKLLSLFAFAFVAFPLYAQETVKTKIIEQDSTLCMATFYFRHGNGSWVDYADLVETSNICYTYRVHPQAKLKIEAWADSSGDESKNAMVSQGRANTIRKYYIQQGINSNDIISVKGNGVDVNAKSDSLARRAEVRLVLTVTKEVAVEKQEPKRQQEEVKEDSNKEIIPRDSIAANDEKIVEQIEDKDAGNQEESVETTPKTTPEGIVSEPAQCSKFESLIKDKLAYYAGVGLGVSFGKSTFASFAAHGAKVGVNTNLFVGAEFSKLFSAEIAVGYTAMTLGVYDCCEGLYYVDGERYFASVAGEASYAYHDLTAKTNLWAITAKANFNIMSLISEDSKWQALVIPNIGVGFSSAELRYNNLIPAKESNTHFIVGGALGAGYSINERWGVRLTSGVDYLTGGAFDAMPQCEHTNGYIWNTTASAIYKF